MSTQAVLCTEQIRSTSCAERPDDASVDLKCLFGSPELIGASMSFSRNAEIYGEGESSDYVYMVLSGAVRVYSILTDGRRQIGSFYLPGDVFGLESTDRHSSSAEAISETKVLLVRRSTVFKSAEQNGEIARHLWTITAKELTRSQRHALLLIKSAKQRLADFLLEMAARAPLTGPLELPMPRQDIADYLGLTIETISRTITQMSNTSTIELIASRRIVLRNRPALNRLNA